MGNEHTNYTLPESTLDQIADYFDEANYNFQHVDKTKFKNLLGEDLSKYVGRQLSWN